MITTHRGPLPEGQVVYRINTGAPLPAGADAVIMVEDTRVHSTFVDSTGKTEEKEIEILAQVDVGENVREPGSDVKRGDLVLEKGTLISSAGGEIGTLAFIGKARVIVSRFFLAFAQLLIYHVPGQSLSEASGGHPEHRK